MVSKAIVVTVHICISKHPIIFTAVTVSETLHSVYLHSKKHHIRLILSSCIAPARSATSPFRILLNRMALIGTFGRIACRTDVWLQCRFLPYPWSICYERDRGSKAESRRTCCLSERVGHTVERQGKFFDRLQVEGCPTYTMSAVK
jgi:hypothetical protein